MTTRTVIITVKALHPAALLDPLDREVAGIYAVELGDDGEAYPDTPRHPPAEGDDPLHEAALDAFHDRVPIDKLDDFEVETDTLADGDDVPEGAAWI